MIESNRGTGDDDDDDDDDDEGERGAEMTRAMMSMRAMPSSCATSRRCEGPSSSSPSTASSSSTIGARGAARATRRPRVALARERTIARDGNAEFANDSGGYERYMRDAEEEEATTAERRGAKGGDEAANVVEDEAGRAQGENYEDEFAGLIRSRKEAAETETRKRWNEGAATPRVAFDLGQDYVRRVSVAYPYAVVGSSRGDVVVCDVISASALAVSPVAHKKSWKDADARPLGERVLLGAHDGGAVTSVAITKTERLGKHGLGLVSSGGRDGTVRLYEVCTNSAALHEIGRVQHDDVVTGLTFARGSLWTTALDGRLCRWATMPSAAAMAELASSRHARESFIDADDDDFTRPPVPELTKQGEWRNGQPTLCMSACEKTGVIAIGNADGSVGVLSADSTSFRENALIKAWVAHEGSTVRAIAYCAGNGIVTGGGDGVIRVWRMMMDDDVGFDSLPMRQSQKSNIRPQLVAELRGHTAAVVSLATGCAGRLVSGAHDGTIRVWDLDLTCSKPGQKIKTIRRDARYAVLGHTIWLGGTYADEKRIICDGANNVLLEYDFSSTPDDGDA